jgi:hypothetical protein
VETWRRAVQPCPDRHPAVGSMMLWGTVQNYPACPVAPWFADAHQTTTHHHHVPFWDTDPLPYTDPMMHHAMSESKKHPQDVLSFRTLFPNDPATKVRLCHLAKTSLTVNIVLHVRISSQSLKTTCSDGSLIENLTAMTSPFLPPSGTQSA